MWWRAISGCPAPWNSPAARRIPPNAAPAPGAARTADQIPEGLPWFAI